ncbi:MAG: type IV toxin-antitoxin system AbiEi family antitoxin domain-containing protein [Caldilineaceae bacterium SB0662_bin_9]|uniref:Type IV toxin-antitoxin system AbiEi family antitoxin domain-containing protein n=1 Tax=Caldilineaceae bacterium SB0662_bin_9 TaxID=2605258 RepID=A0A6B1DWZ7_9CHLR|nr:type IV toxin-antitoxin system AbiEi family antitoxin domain-containing protein [Caldilineaceae bacterium SB0662_bin_9]
MTGLSSRILQLADESAEGTLLCANALLHLGTRAAVDQALSRLARRGELMRICQGVYVRPVQTRFGPCPPSIPKVLSSLSTLWGETIVDAGGREANALGLTNQVPVRLVCLTSGPNRKLKFGRQIVELRHAPRWQLTAPHQPAGAVVRALAWLGPGEVEEGLEQVGRRLLPEDLRELAKLRAVMPSWMAQSVSALVADGQHAL